jgi:hypothetical protein
MQEKQGIQSLNMRRFASTNYCEERDRATGQRLSAVITGIPGLLPLILQPGTTAGLRLQPSSFHRTGC